MRIFLGMVAVVVQWLPACGHGSRAVSVPVVTDRRDDVQVASVEPPADAGDESGAPVRDRNSGAAARFRPCESDADCIAVDRVGCCHNGWKEAVASAQAGAYARSFTCPDQHPICAMYIVRDERVPRCSEKAHLCTMTER